MDKFHWEITSKCLLEQALAIMNGCYIKHIKFDISKNVEIDFSFKIGAIFLSVLISLAERSSKLKIQKKALTM